MIKVGVRSRGERHDKALLEKKQYGKRKQLGGTRKKRRKSTFKRRVAHLEKSLRSGFVKEETKWGEKLICNETRHLTKTQSQGIADLKKKGKAGNVTLKKGRSELHHPERRHRDLVGEQGGRRSFKTRSKCKALAGHTRVKSGKLMKRGGQLEKWETR